MSMVGSEKARRESKEKKFMQLVSPQKNDLGRTVVLDLDNTLVYSTFKKPRLYDFCLEVPGKKNLQIYVKVRPHAVEFISIVGAIYEVIIFTAAKKEYAEKVIGIIDANKRIAYSLYRDSCTLVNGKYVKDLCKLGKPLNEVILVDDSPHSYEFQPHNGIHIPPYTGEKDDDSLLKIMKFLREIHEDGMFGSIHQTPF